MKKLILMEKKEIIKVLDKIFNAKVNSVAVNNVIYKQTQTLKEEKQN